MVGVAFALACLTRYEAWPVTVSALVAAAWTRWRRGQPLAAALRDVGAVAVYPAVAVAGFAVFSRVVIGEWFVGSDFFVPENKALGDPMMAAAEIGWGARMLSGALLAWIGGAGVAVSVVDRPRQPQARRRAHRAGPARHGRHSVDRVSQRPSVPHPLHGAADGGRGDRRRPRGWIHPGAPRARRVRVALLVARRSTNCARSTRRRRW